MVLMENLIISLYIEKERGFISNSINFDKRNIDTFNIKNISILKS